MINADIVAKVKENLKNSIKNKGKNINKRILDALAEIIKNQNKILQLLKKMKDD